MDLAPIFSETPGATPLDGLADAWHWAMAPGFDFTAALSADRKHAFQCYALDSYDEDLLIAVLSFARDHDELIAPPEQPLKLVEGFSHQRYKFDVVVAVGPAVHLYHEESPEVNQQVRAIFPAFRCEFAGDEDFDDTMYRYTRAAGVQATKLDREPRPYVKMRYLTESGREIPKRGFAPVPHLVIQLGRLEGSDRFVEFENYRHEVYRIDWDGQYVVSGESSHRFSHDELLEFVKGTIYGPNIDAGTSEFRDHN